MNVKGKSKAKVFRPKTMAELDHILQNCLPYDVVVVTDVSWPLGLEGADSALPHRLSPYDKADSPAGGLTSSTAAESAPSKPNKKKGAVGHA